MVKKGQVFSLLTNYTHRCTIPYAPGSSEGDAEVKPSAPFRGVMQKTPRWTMTNEVIQGSEWATYGALETYHQDETRDSLPGASLMGTE